MTRFPTVCVDGFWEDPDEIRRIALELPYDNLEDNQGRYPGRRTLRLERIMPELHTKFCDRFFSLFYDYGVTNVRYKVHAGFQLIDPFSDQYNHILNQGWVHKDAEMILGGVIYLNPNPDPECGTSLGYLKEPRQDDPTAKERVLAGDTSQAAMDAYTKSLELNISNFVETVKFSNVYNRMICFDAGVDHKANNMSNNFKDTRLTLVFFVEKIDATSLSPLERMRCF
jgi:hypothetical protein